MFKHLFQALKWGSMAPDVAPPAGVTAGPPAAPAAPPAPATPRRLSELSMAALHAQRQALDRQQRQTFDDLQGLHGDCRGVVARYAAARVQGRPHELQGLERVYDNLEARVQSAELRHADQLHRLKLIDHVCVLREDLAARQALEQGALSGLDLNELKAMLDHELAALLSSRGKVDELLGDIETFSEDARLQAAGSMRSTRETLMALTEGEVERAAAMRLSALDEVAQRLEQGQPLAERAASGSVDAARVQGEAL